MVNPAARKRPGNKAVPYLSHEFIIQNHGDIATCFCMIFIIGLMFQVFSDVLLTTTPLASAFIAPKHNTTEIDYTSKSPILYSYGLKDICLVFFYSIAAIIFHAIVQEYVLDKLIRKIRLSKTKANKFNESGQLFSFYLVSAIWAFFVFREEGYFQSLSFFWTGYPHVGITFLTKFFFIIQLSYWVHAFPELYFQKVKKEEMGSKIFFASINLLVCLAIYTLNLTRIGLTLLFIDQLINIVFHLSRILYFSGKNKIAKIAFNVYNVLFVLARLTVIILSIFVFWFGLKASSVEQINWEEKNFNTPLVRTACLAAVLALQAYMLWNFILFQCQKIRENSKPSSTSKSTVSKINPKKKTTSDSDVDSDQANSADESKKSN